MKLAVFSDLHAHNFKEFDRKTDRTGSSRLDNIVDTLVYIRDYCVAKQIKYVLFGGGYVPCSLKSKHDCV
jgi:hypothetical protein